MLEILGFRHLLEPRLKSFPALSGTLNSLTEQIFFHEQARQAAP